jgi:ferritin
MLNPRMQDALNAQVNAEYYSAYLYLSMAAKLADLGVPGGVNWMKVQFQEELAHAGMFFDYIIERGGEVKLADIAAEEKVWQTPLAAYEAVLAHEQHVTELIGNLADLALEIKDHSTFQFLQWFIAEQVEEESAAQGVIDKLRLVGDAAGGLYQVDNELATRVFTPPVVAST